MKLYTWLVGKFVLVIIWLITAVIGTIAGWYMHAILMEVLR